MHADQLAVDADGRGAGGKPEHAGAAGTGALAHHRCNALSDRARQQLGRREDLDPEVLPAAGIEGHAGS